MSIVDQRVHHLYGRIKDIQQQEGATISLDNSLADWTKVAKFTVTVYANVLERLLADTLPLAEDIKYWRHVEESPVWSMTYLAQTFPLRLIDSVKSIYSGTEFKSVVSASLSLSIFSRVRFEAKTKRKRLLEIRNDQAIKIGRLICEDIQFNSLSELPDAVIRLVSIMDDKKDMKSIKTIRSITEITETLQRITQQNYLEGFNRPSFLTRYWIPGLFILLLSSSASSYIIKRQNDIRKWIHDTFDTLFGFIRGWILAPLHDIYITIRHKDTLSLVSKDSLRSDLDSLERMVQDFARKEYNMTDMELIHVAKQAREGDLTTVLRVYENEIRNPFRSAIAGSLIQALLIQIQRTKVDVELAMSGIDKLLKSQELTFGFIGVTPSLLIVYFAMTWLSNKLSRRSYLRGAKSHATVRESLHEIDRLLDSNQELSWKEQGLLMCHVHFVRIYVDKRQLKDLWILQDPKANIQTKRRAIKRIFQYFYV